MTEHERDYMKYRITGTGQTTENAKFDAIKDVNTLYERYRRLGQKIYIIQIVENILYRDEYRAFKCDITIEYEVIE